MSRDSRMNGIEVISARRTEHQRCSKE